MQQYGWDSLTEMTKQTWNIYYSMGTTTWYISCFWEIPVQVYDSINGTIINTICILIIPDSQYVSQVQLGMTE